MLLNVLTNNNFMTKFRQVWGIAGSLGLTGGVYKARERIHRGEADPRLLAIPAS